MKHGTKNMRTLFAGLMIPAMLLLSCFRIIAGEEANEYKLKAMFVLNFMKYVEWPEKSQGEFTIGVAGESEIYDELVKMTANRKESMKINIEKANSEVAGNYKILIVTKSESRRIEHWNKLYSGKGILIITDDYKNLDHSAINLITINNKIRFEINNSQAKSSGVKISSRLAELAVTVQP